MRKSKVESSWVKTASYNQTTKELTLQTAGGSYVYSDVSLQKAEALQSAESIGKFVNTHIKPHHKFRLKEGK